MHKNLQDTVPMETFVNNKQPGLEALLCPKDKTQMYHHGIVSNIANTRLSIFLLIWSYKAMDCCVLQSY